VAVVPPAFPVSPPPEPAVPAGDDPDEPHPPTIPAAQNAKANERKSAEVRESSEFLFAINFLPWLEFRETVGESSGPKVDSWLNTVA
jgi:hypothetical protein